MLLIFIQSRFHLNTYQIESLALESKISDYSLRQVTEGLLFHPLLMTAVILLLFLGVIIPIFLTKSFQSPTYKNNRISLIRSRSILFKPTRSYRFLAKKFINIEAIIDRLPRVFFIQWYIEKKIHIFKQKKLAFILTHERLLTCLLIMNSLWSISKILPYKIVKFITAHKFISSLILIWLIEIILISIVFIVFHNLNLISNFIKLFFVSVLNKMYIAVSNFSLFELISKFLLSFKKCILTMYSKFIAIPKKIFDFVEHTVDKINQNIVALIDYVKEIVEEFFNYIRIIMDYIIEIIEKYVNYLDGFDRRGDLLLLIFMIVADPEFLVTFLDYFSDSISI